jgi:hypothetical protein
MTKPLELERHPDVPLLLEAVLRSPAMRAGAPIGHADLPDADGRRAARMLRFTSGGR